MAAVRGAGRTPGHLHGPIGPVGALGPRRIHPRAGLPQLARTRLVAIVLNTGFVFWILALFGVVDPGLRAPVALLVFMGCVILSDRVLLGRAKPVNAISFAARDR